MTAFRSSAFCMVLASPKTCCSIRIVHLSAFVPALSGMQDFLQDVRTFVGRPDADLLFAFQPQTETFTSLLNGCTDPLTKAFFESVANGSIKRGSIASSLRLISSVYGNALMQARCGSLSNFDIGKAIDQRKVLLIEGGGPGVSPHAANTPACIDTASDHQLIRTLKWNPDFWTTG